MTLEQLQAMSDNELNELSAVKVMEYDKEGIDVKYMMARGEWNPCDDIYYAWELLKRMKQSLFSERRNFMHTLQQVISHGKMSSGELVIAWPEAIWHMTPRDITIAAILAKEG